MSPIGAGVIVGVGAVLFSQVPLDASPSTDLAGLAKRVETLEKELATLKQRRTSAERAGAPQEKVVALGQRTTPEAVFDYAQKEIVALGARITAEHDYAQKEIVGLGARVVSIEKDLKEHRSGPGLHHSHQPFQYAPYDHTHPYADKNHTHAK